MPRLSLLTLVVLALCAGDCPCFAPPAGAATAPAPIADLTDSAAVSRIHPALRSAVGEVEVTIRLDQPALAVAAGAGAKRSGALLGRQQQLDHVASLRQTQDQVVAQVVKAGGREVARLTKALNAVIVRVDASALPTIAGHPSVQAVNPIQNAEMFLSETVPYIGAAEVQRGGVDGAGVRVAVIDSGIDYTHRNLGGLGTVAAYLAAHGAGPLDPRNASRDGLFPTEKVVGGYDFVGESWPNGPLAPDDDPIDLMGHGTHVADIIAGKSVDGTHVGVAPGAKLYAFKACSAVASSCSGVALLQSVDAALDPNGNDSIDDAVDVMNLSLGSSYGQIQDDLTAAIQAAVEFGVVVVCAAGNSGDLPYVVSSPSIAPGAISVAQTEVPGAKKYKLGLTGAGVPGGAAAVSNTASLDWAPVSTGATGPLVVGGTACNPYPAGTDFTGKVVLIERGTCAISVKVDRAAKLGAVGVIIANSVAGDPPSFTFGGSSDGARFRPVPSLVITDVDGRRIKGWLASGAVVASIDPSVFISVAGSVVASSARGPSSSFNTIKPEIGAPGASLSAEAGTGTGETVFGGTSGATPMIAGSAALLLQKFPNLQPWEVKARLMNSAFSGVMLNPVKSPGVLAPVTRVGAGEVRVNRAISLQLLAYDSDTREPSLSFGYLTPTATGGTLKIRQRVTVQNLGTVNRRVTASNSFRDASDVALGAVSVSIAPASVTVPPRGRATLTVTVELDPTKLRDWSLNAGSQGGNGELLRQLEIDGDIVLASGTERTSVPWQVLPHKAADNSIDRKKLEIKDATESFRVRNDHGAKTGYTELFSLVGTSGVDFPQPPVMGINVAHPDLAAAGVRYLADVDLLQIAIATHDTRAQALYPAEFDVWLDTNGDGVADYVAFNAERGGFGITGQSVVWVLDARSGVPISLFFNDSDFNASTAIFTLPLGALGLTPDQPIGFFVEAYDNYFTGSLSDVIADPSTGFFTFTPAHPRFLVTDSQVEVPAGGRTTVNVSYDALGETASPSQMGLLGIHRDSVVGAGWETLPISVNLHRD